MKNRVDPIFHSMQYDNFGRHIDYLRISVTDRCNLRCIYCMPRAGIESKPPSEILTFEELAEVARVAVGMGINKIRITGGEPLVRKDIVRLVGLLASIEGVKDLAMTTNGALLGQFACRLKEAGLKRINVSLDTLEPGMYRRITKFGELRDVLAGLRKASELKFWPIKLNVVVIRGLNDSELSDFARLTFAYPYFVRFIEFMPIGNREEWTRDRVLLVAEMKSRLNGLGRLERVNGEIIGCGPAEYYRLAGSIGQIGFIGPISNNFCERCNRLRLSADGRLRSCLYSESYIDVRAILRNNTVSKEKLRQALIVAIYGKPQGHGIRAEGPTVMASCVMSEIGG